jgi:transcriptional regulator of acetoin/glycerol metabolism
LRKRRRIEITAFRRQVTVYAGVQDRTRSDDPSSHREKPLNDAGTTRRTKTDFAASQLPVVDVARSGELASLVKALLESEGNTSVAARRLGLSRSSFYSQLRKLGLSLRQLKARLNLMSHRRATKSMANNKGRAEEFKGR